MSLGFLRQGAAESAPATSPPPWLADDFLESYVCWREECAEVRGAYERWQGVEPPDRALAFAAYRAALDREERAAGVFRDRTEQIRGRSS